MTLNEIYKLEQELILLLSEMNKYKFWTAEYNSLIPKYNKLRIEINYKKSLLTNTQLKKYLKE